MLCLRMCVCVRALCNGSSVLRTLHARQYQPFVVQVHWLRSKDIECVALQTICSIIAAGNSLNCNGEE